MNVFLFPWLVPSPLLVHLPFLLFFPSFPSFLSSVLRPSIHAMQCEGEEEGSAVRSPHLRRTKGGPTTGALHKRAARHGPRHSAPRTQPVMHTNDTQANHR